MFTNHQIPLARLDKSRIHTFCYTPNAAVLKTIASDIEFRKVSIEKIEGTLTPIDGGADLNAKIIGQLTQNCVISGAPVHTKLNHKIERKFRHDIPQFEVDIAHEEGFDDSFEYIPANLELNDLICESILLIAPEYPKLQKYMTNDEWSYVTGNIDDTEETVHFNPFAGLDEKLFGKKTDNS